MKMGSKVQRLLELAGKVTGGKSPAQKGSV